MLWGHHLLNWISVGSIPILFYLGLLPLEVIEKLWPLMGIKIDYDSIEKAITYTWSIRMNISHEGLRTPGYRLTLDFNLFLFLGLGCKDARDHVYAILGISEDAQELGIVPDYQYPENQVFIDMSMRIYLRSQSLAFCRILASSNHPAPQCHLGHIGQCHRVRLSSQNPSHIRRAKAMLDSRRKTQS